MGSGGGSDAYSSFKPGGSLKFKGGDDASSSKKHKKDKKHKSKSSSHPSSSSSLKHKDSAADTAEELRRLAEQEEDEERQRASGSSGGRKMTDAERRFAEVQRKRMAERVRKEAGKSHKERVGDFNKYLEKLSEHHDIPKVGPG
ncbi:DUF1754-domain-containing protein [Jaminaea rosea]|uniref:DUF1754-domain-containing protein n=1 Tax=Jaminaea rosea TaxID=1569628 RepID=A0A316UZB1_9BASI|nr:DUF1754-domain-containing protein [Jaminaea rosea]PWN30616.1 DUF1754-domain-containing protein [Jaminaea rosea]